MKIIVAFIGTIGAIAFAFVGMPMLMFGSGASGGKPVPEIVKMVTNANANRATQLSSSQRQNALDLCLATFREQRKPGMVDEENTAKLRASLEGGAKSACNCVISAVRDKTNTMAFAMAMSMRFVVAKDLDPEQISIGEQINYSAFDDIALQVGLSEKAMAETRVNALNAVVAAAEKCR